MREQGWRLSIDDDCVIKYHIVRYDAYSMFMMHTVNLVSTVRYDLKQKGNPSQEILSQRLLDCDKYLIDKV